jgi:serine-type D-Ala-D-Ala carboxypeptidase/endopeptidase (penicillin-binding protein 4)
VKGRVLALLSASLCLVSLTMAKPPETPLSHKERTQQLQAKIDKIIKKADPNVNIGVIAVSLKTGLVVYEKNAARLFIPSDCVKMLTSAAALDILGPDYHFETVLLTDGLQEQGKLKGNLYLKGSGDPSLTYQDLQQLAFQLKVMGIEQVQGALFLDNSDFDDLAQGPGWMQAEVQELGWSSLHALQINHNAVDIWVRPAKTCAEIFVSPPTDYVVLKNESIVADESETVQVYRASKENTIVVKGNLPPTSQPLSYTISVEHPPLYAGVLFKQALEMHGIHLSDPISIKRAGENTRLLAKHRSDSLSVLVRKMMREKDHLYADCLFKKMGQYRFEMQGSWQNGSRAIREFLDQKAGIDTSEIVVLDGSGLSRYNMISPKQLVDLLVHMKQQFLYADEFSAALSVNGKEGVLQERVRGQDFLAKVRGEAGEMKGVSSLSGYLMTQKGEELAFTIFINGFVKSASEYKTNLEDEICKAFIQY